MELKDKLISQLDRHFFPPRGSSLVVGVSGGVDSVVLLHVLYLLAAQYDWEIIVAHFNHHLREGAIRDAQFVISLAKSFGLKSMLGNADVKKMAAAKKLTVEEAGRMARYNWLQKIACQTKAQTIAIAHTADDQTETIVMNWLRGGLVRALAGMRVKEKNIWRPFLLIPKSELCQFAKEYSIEYWEDASNKNLAYMRNLVRHKVLPMLEQVNPGIRGVMVRNALNWSDLEIGLEHYTQNIYEKVARKSSAEAVNFSEAKFSKLDKFWQNELLLLAVQKLKGDRQDINRVHLEEAQAVLMSRTPRVWKQLPGKLFLFRGYGKISVSRHRPKFVNK